MSNTSKIAALQAELAGINAELDDTCVGEWPTARQRKLHDAKIDLLTAKRRAIKAEIAAASVAPEREFQADVELAASLRAFEIAKQRQLDGLLRSMGKRCA